MQELPQRPAVTLTRSTALPTSERLEPPRRRRPSALLLLPVLALVLALTTSRGGPATSPAPEPPLDVELLLLPERLSVTQSGILVLTVELRNGGEALQVRSAAAYASPVVDDPVLQAPTEVRARDRRRFVALVAPDCRLLQNGSALQFSATVLMRVGRGSLSRDLMLDLVGPPEIRDRVSGLCPRS